MSVIEIYHQLTNPDARRGWSFATATD